MEKKKTISPTKPGQKPISFNPGGLHKALGVPEGQKIPADKMAAALSGKYGDKVKRMAKFAKNVLAKGRKTVAGKPKRKMLATRPNGLPRATKLMRKKMGFKS